MYSICIAEKEIRLCKYIAKFALFSMQNFAFWMQNLRLKKTTVGRDDHYVLVYKSLMISSLGIFFLHSATTTSDIRTFWL